MILEAGALVKLGALGMSLYGIQYWKHYDEIKIKNKWKELMHSDDTISKGAKGAVVKPTFDILRVIEKEYGYDLIVSLPLNKSYDELEKIKDRIECAFECDILMQLSKEKNSAYIRLLKDLSKSDNLAFELKWQKIMLKAGIKNHDNETFIINKIISKDKDGKDLAYGKDLIIELTEGLSYKKLEETIPIIESNFNCVTEIDWQRFKGCAYLKMADEDFNEKEPFKPIETKSHELYFGQTFFREYITADMKSMPHVLIEGATGSGKSRCFFIALTNLIHNHDDIDLYLAQTSDKQDLKKFANVRQCCYYAKDLQHTDQLIKHLLSIQKERNQLLAKLGLDNIGDYNKKFPSKKMNYIYFCIDEFKSLNPPVEKGVDPQGYTIKNRIMFNFSNLIQESRSAGIFMILCIQRPDKASIPPVIKQYLNILVAFRANNKSTSKVMVDDERAWNLPNREAIFMGSTDKTMKTMFIDNNVIKKYIKDKIENEHEYVDIYGNKKDDKVIKLPITSQDEVAATKAIKKNSGDVKVNGLSD